jgi:hypothetical protein
MYKKVKEITSRLKKEDNSETNTISNSTLAIPTFDEQSNPNLHFASPQPKKRFVDKLKKFGARDSRNDESPRPVSVVVTSTEDTNLSIAKPIGNLHTIYY